MNKNTFCCFLLRQTLSVFDHKDSTLMSFEEFYNSVDTAQVFEKISEIFDIDFSICEVETEMANELLSFFREKKQIFQNYEKDFGLINEMKSGLLLFNALVIEFMQNKG